MAEAACCRSLRTVIFGLALLATGLASAAPSPDLQRELRLTGEIADGILDGEVEWLDASDGQRFLAIYAESEWPVPLGTVVLLHGRGLHADWQNLIHPLRVGLLEHGWHTLSIQLPVLHRDAKYYDYAGIFDFAGPRIEAALEMVGSRTQGKRVMLAHSCGGHMAQRWLHRRAGDIDLWLDGFIGIGMGATDFGQLMLEPFVYDRLRIPLLDVYGEYDYRGVRRLAPERLAALLQGGHRLNRQKVVQGADHDHVGYAGPLLALTADWLAGLGRDATQIPLSSSGGTHQAR